MCPRLPLLFASLMLAAVAGAQAPTTANAQDVLTLEEALQLARQRNGTLRAVNEDVRAGRARVAQANALFFPSLTPQYQYSDVRRERDRQTFFQSGGVSLLRFSWQILDNGQRDFNLRATRRGTESIAFNARQTVRSTLFTVTQQYYDALRSQELERVAKSQVQRAQTTLEQTRARIAVRDAAAIEELQANVDFQNAKVSALTARNRVTNSAASLRATVGLESGETMPTLQRDLTPPDVQLPNTVDALIAEGLSTRPDLISRRRSIDAQVLNRRRAQRDATVSFSMDVFDEYQVTPDSLNDRTFQLTASIPLFDGFRRREAVREVEANIRSDRSDLIQAERNARAEIEAAYAELATNVERLSAALVARDAAQKNFAAAQESRALGATDLLNVITAQVSLVTAESNYIEALYDTRISEARLRLVTGRPVPGESQ